jgi:urease alpha subunit
MTAWADEDAADENARVLRYLAKYTVEPARVHGIEADVGSLTQGRLADIVLWRPTHFGVKPELVLKAGHFAWGAGALGEGNASVALRPSLGGAGRSRPSRFHHVRLAGGAR